MCLDRWIHVNIVYISMHTNIYIYKHGSIYIYIIVIYVHIFEQTLSMKTELTSSLADLQTCVNSSVVPVAIIGSQWKEIITTLSFQLSGTYSNGGWHCNASGGRERALNI